VTTLNTVSAAPEPASGHGREYAVMYASTNGKRGSFRFRFNGYEFNTPAGQAFFEAQVVCQRDGSELKAAVCASVTRVTPGTYVNHMSPN